LPDTISTAKSRPSVKDFGKKERWTIGPVVSDGTPQRRTTMTDQAQQKKGERLGEKDVARPIPKGKEAKSG